jgi:hypothetical protein
MFSQQIFNTVSTKKTAAGIREKRIVGLAGSLSQPTA